MLTIEQNNRAFGALWEHSLIGLAFVKEDGTFIAANPAFCAITEYTEYELQQMAFADITHPADREPDIHMVKRLIAGDHEQYTMKKRYITKTGRTVWVVLRARGVRNEKGELEFFLSQVSELIELQPPKLPVQYPSAYELSRTVRTSTLISWIVKFWPIILAGAGAFGILGAEIIKHLNP